MRATEFITEYRNRLLQYVKSLLPTWPEYVLKDWLVPNKGDFSNLPDTELKNGIMEKLQGAGLTPDTKWQLVPDMKFTMDMFDPMTKQRLIGRAGGKSDLGMQIPRDAERHATQAALAQQQGGVRKEPVLLIKMPNGYELLEGWHRTIQHFAQYPQGYTGPAWVAVAQGPQGVAEGSLNESAVFLNPTTVVVGQAHGQPLELSPDTLKKIQDIAAKHGAWYEGNGTDRSYTKGQIDRYVGSWDDEVAKTASPNDPKWLYVLFANVDENNRVKRVGVDPKDTIFNRLMDSAQDNSFQGIGFTALALKKFLSMASEGKYDFVKMSQQPATQENLTRFLKAGEALMWPSNWEQYPNKAGKIAKAATVDVRDQYLATRKAGVYVTGSGHLKAVQNITGQQGVAEGKVINTYLWHGSRQKIPMLEPRQAVDTGGAAGSNQNAIYATSDPIFAIQMGMPTAGSDYGNFPNDPQMVLFSGKIRKGEYVYLHKLPFNGPDGKPQFVQGGNSREFHSIPGVEGIKPIEIKEIPVNKYLNLIRKATPADLKLRKKYMKEQGVTENFADGKNPGRKGLSRRVGIPKKATLGQLEKIAGSSTGERRRMAQWQLNMRRGKKK